MHPLQHPEGKVHPTATFGENVQLGENVWVGPQVVLYDGVRIGSGSIIHAGCVLMTDAVIGENCEIFPKVVIQEDSIIGDRVILQSGSVIGADGHGYFQREGVNQKIPQVGRVVIEDDVEIGANTIICESKIGDNTKILPFSHIDASEIGTKCSIGPYARLREGSVIMDGARIGNFVETKKTSLGRDSKANHFTYLGDAEVGDEVNIGAGTITCNYDGKDKHKTNIGDNSFVGTNSSLVAPVTVGKNAYVGAGSTITKDIPDNALGVGRGKQKNKENWSKTKK